MLAVSGGLQPRGFGKRVKPPMGARAHRCWGFEVSRARGSALRHRLLTRVTPETHCGAETHGSLRPRRFLRNITLIILMFWPISFPQSRQKQTRVAIVFKIVLFFYKFKLIEAEWRTAMKNHFGNDDKWTTINNGKHSRSALAHSITFSRFTPSRWRQKEEGEFDEYVFMYQRRCGTPVYLPCERR